jgi:hypothetical protein
MPKVKDGKPTHTLRLECGHVIQTVGKPNPRKVWPDPQLCPTHKRKQRVVEIKSPRVEVSHLTSPYAPKKYKRLLEKGKR